jgi:ACS family glucarate transporter-like MFS transporter
MVNYGWQSAFYIAGGLGLMVAAVWWLYARDRPQDHPAVNDAERRLIEAGHVSAGGRAPVPWSAFARTPTIWWLVLSYTCLGYVAYVYMSWFYLYLVNERGFGVLRGALFAAGPFLAITVFCPLGGWVTDRLATRLGTSAGRVVTGCAGMVLSGASILVGSRLAAPYLAIALLSLGAGWLYFTVGAYWSSTVDLSKAHAGTLSGLMNTGANIGGTLSPTLTPWLAQSLGWSTALDAAAFAALLGALMWLGIRPGEGLRHVIGHSSLVNGPKPTSPH